MPKAAAYPSMVGYAVAGVPVSLFLTNRRGRAAYQRRPWIPEIFEGMCGCGTDNRFRASS
ncbi:MAG TPA: hypothetical protein VN456_00185 [Desulfosporosinus sp.]|nr:hypothetical protein [Desulfosporosinus sp.]